MIPNKKRIKMETKASGLQSKRIKKVIFQKSYADTTASYEIQRHLSKKVTLLVYTVCFLPRW